MRVLVTASTGDTITVEVSLAVSWNPSSSLYVEHRGLFEVVRVEGAYSGHPARLTLRGFPSRK
jgi:hypothetical protein